VRTVAQRTSPENGSKDGPEMVKVSFRCHRNVRRNLGALASLDGMDMEEWVLLAVLDKMERRRQEGIELAAVP
jgi:hypothetical protein